MPVLLTKQEIGKMAEEHALKYLQNLDYIILDTNWQYGHLELDIVAQDGNDLVIVEVKSRNSIRYGHPSDAVTPVKMKRIVEAADAYIQSRNIKLDTRFDIITVIFFGLEWELEHFSDAFYPTL
jgi:putative endonuclease